MNKENNKTINMDEDTFWELIERSKTYSTELGEQNKYLLDILMQLSPKEIIAFQQTMNNLFDGLGDAEKYSGATTPEQNGYETYDLFKYLIISLGKENYYKVRDIPSQLYEVPNLHWSVSSLHEFENINQAHRAFSETTCEQISTYINAFERLEELEQEYASSHINERTIDHHKEQDQDLER